MRTEDRSLGPCSLFPVPCFIDHAAVKRLPVIGAGIDGKMFFDALPCGAAQSLARFQGCMHEGEHGLSERFGTVSGNDRSGIGNQFAHTARIRGHNRLAHAHGFSQGQGHAFPRGTEDKAIGSVEEGGKVAAQPQPADGIVEPQLGGQRTEGR